MKKNKRIQYAYPEHVCGNLGWEFQEIYEKTSNIPGFALELGPGMLLALQSPGPEFWH